MFKCVLNLIVKTPTTTPIQLKTTSTAVGFDYDFAHPTTPPPKLYFRSGAPAGQCKLTQY